MEAVCGGDIGSNERRKGESKDGGEFMILNTTYCRRAFTGVYCEYNGAQKELDSDLKNENKRRV